MIDARLVNSTQQQWQQSESEECVNGWEKKSNEERDYIQKKISISPTVPTSIKVQINTLGYFYVAGKGSGGAEPKNQIQAAWPWMESREIREKLGLCYVDNYKSGDFYIYLYINEKG